MPKHILIYIIKLSKLFTQIRFRLKLFTQIGLNLKIIRYTKLGHSQNYLHKV